MNLLFINPCIRPGSTKTLSVGLGSVMTYVREYGYTDFDFLDIDINEYSDEFVENYLKDNKYDVVLSGSIVTHYQWMKWLTNTVKKYHPDTKVVIGNSVGGSCPEVFLRNSGTDIVVIGEGEITLAEVLDKIRDNGSLHDVEGIAFIDDGGKFIETPKRRGCKIDDLPMIDWDFFDTDLYHEKSDAWSAEGLVFDEDNPPRIMPVIAARGCAFKCTFCHYVYWDDPYRHRSPENVILEIKRNMDKYGATYINFWDDLSFASIPQAEKFVDALLDSGIKINWNASIRVDLFGHPRTSYERRLRVAKKFKESGCQSLFFALESGNQEILDMMNKKIVNDHFLIQIDLLRKADIVVNCTVVFGYPIETKETIQETFNMCLNARIYPSMGFLMPLPYTGMYTYAKENGYIKDEDAYLTSLKERQDINLNMTKMSDDEIMGYISEGAKKLNEMLNLGLDNNSLIKTGGYRKHTEKTVENASDEVYIAKDWDDNRGPLDPDNINRNENDFSYNYNLSMKDKSNSENLTLSYSQAIFETDLGLDNENKEKIPAKKKGNNSDNDSK